MISRVLRCENVVFCENGAQMLDIMMGSTVYDNAVSTKNTSPRYLKAICKLLSSFEHTHFGIDYVLKNSTKAEAISQFLDERLLEKSWSCYSTRQQSEMCGSCWNCFSARMSAVAAGFPETLHFEVDPLSEVLNKSILLDNQRILYNMLVFYSKILNHDEPMVAEINRYNDFFANPEDLATRFALDLFLGVSECLSLRRERNGLGKKAQELLFGIDRSLLEDRREALGKLRERRIKESEL